MKKYKHPRRPDNPCPKCGGITFYATNGACVTCRMQMVAEQQARKAEREYGQVKVPQWADHTPVIDRNKESKMMQDVRYD